MNRPALTAALIGSALASALAAGPASAANPPAIIGLFNTGTDADNVALTGGNGQIDQHYTIFASSVSGLAGSQGVTFDNGAYVANDANSRWISGNATGLDGVNTTVFRLTFSLTGFDAASASLSGAFGTDNFGRLFLNGQDTGVEALQQFLALTTFNLTGLVNGTNTLDFHVDNRGGPMALRVDDLEVTANIAGVPEPSAWALLILGFGAVGAGMRARRPAPALA